MKHHSPTPRLMNKEIGRNKEILSDLLETNDSVNITPGHDAGSTAMDRRRPGIA